MKLFFISDLHGSVDATKAVLTQYESSQADFLILLGDILNHGPRNPVPEGYNPGEVAKRLNHYQSDIIAVRGNCDSEVDQMLLDFPMMSDYAMVLLPNRKKLFLTHGHLYHQDNRSVLNKGDILCHGHSHLPQAGWQGDHFIFNPGSITFPRNQSKASYGTYQDGVFSIFDLSGKCILQQRYDK